MAVEYRVGSDGKPTPTQGSDAFSLLSTDLTASYTTSGQILRDQSAFVGYLIAIGTGGSNPTATVQYQDSPDDSNYANISGALETLTAAGTKRVAMASPTGKYVRATGSISGTTPTFSGFQIIVVAKT